MTRNRQVYFAIKIDKKRWHFNLDIADLEDDDEILHLKKRKIVVFRSKVISKYYCMKNGRLACHFILHVKLLMSRNFLELVNNEINNFQILFF